MHTRLTPRIFIWTILFVLLGLPLTAVAQENANTLRVSLSRDFGSDFGGRISGTFSIRVNDPPPATARVVFLLDEAEIGTDDSAPFRFQFRTGNFEPGSHTLTAIANDSNGNEISRGTISRTFMSSSESNNIIFWVVVPLLILIIGGRYLANWLTDRQNPGKPAISGPLGGAICPNCAKPFAFHIWSINFVIFRIDRCPHCGKWVRATRASHDTLQSVAKDLKDSKEPLPPATDNQDRRLDDSRFEN